LGPSTSDGFLPHTFAKISITRSRTTLPGAGATIEVLPLAGFATATFGAALFTFFALRFARFVCAFTTLFFEFLLVLLDFFVAIVISRLR
jgi:hypothetical protein